MGAVQEAFAEVRARVNNFKEEQKRDYPLNADIVAGMNHVLGTMESVEYLYDTEEVKQAEHKKVETRWSTRLGWAIDDLFFPSIPRVAAMGMTAMILANFIWIVRHWER